MRRYLFSLLFATPLLALAQAKPTPNKAPIVLAPGNMRVQAGGGADNRPDRAPEFPGGAEAMGDFFTEHVQVPSKAKAARVTGDVLVTATVGTDGKLSNPKVAKGLTPECNAEALRVVQTLPPWQPATRRGVPVPVLVQVPVPFDNAAVTKFENDRRVPRSAKDAPGLH